MKFAGCDIGSLTAKAVIADGRKVLGTAIIKSGSKPDISAREVVDKALCSAGLSMDDIDYAVGTGYGREKIPFVHETKSEITCHARGARYLLPAARTVIDIGGQDCKAIRLTKEGDVERFVTNDKCASGTGRFLEVMADVLGISMEELGTLSRKGKKPVTLSSTCTVWAQADVIRLVGDRIPLPDIASGICTAMAQRMAILAGSVGLEKDICMTGGVAKNAGVVTALEKQTGSRIKRIRKMDPQLVGALGAALIAGENAWGGQR